MGRIFLNTPEEGQPLAKKGMARGFRLLEEIWERFEVIGGHLEWRKQGKNGLLPRLIIDGTISDSESGIFPKAFDVKSIDPDTGTLTLTRCKWQIGSKYYSHADVSLTAQTGTLCAVLNTTDGALTAQMDYEWTDTQPELVPYALYDITVSTVDDKQVVVITCDRRGSSINIYE